jgi:hypothetical protein
MIHRRCRLTSGARPVRHVAEAAVTDHREGGTLGDLRCIQQSRIKAAELRDLVRWNGCP